MLVLRNIFLRTTAWKLAKRIAVMPDMVQRELLVKFPGEGVDGRTIVTARRLDAHGNLFRSMATSELFQLKRFFACLHDILVCLSMRFNVVCICRSNTTAERVRWRCTGGCPQQQQP